MINIDSIKKYFPAHVRDNGALLEYMIKEYLQCTILQIISASKYAHGLTMTGGTALRLFHNTQRFSEDIIDFDSKFYFQEVTGLMDYLFFSIKRQNYDVIIKPKHEDSFTWNINISGSNFAGRQKIRLDFLDYDVDYKRAPKYLNRLGATCLINIPDDSTLLSMKIHSFLKRQIVKLRDVYDIVYLIGYTFPDMHYLKKTIAIGNIDKIKDAMIKRFTSINIKKHTMSFKPLLFHAADFENVVNFSQIIEDWKV
ncbi:MAG: nucleotidyl transferase AbiEii/AbiGii toxin family protein [Bacteroidia bacterium]|nr:nucleotidyl transferase AbiEii/AbiGii toxin family protein [Bacteroidia bacterium]